jgi:hypothetical protein
MSSRRAIAPGVRTLQVRVSLDSNTDLRVGDVIEVADDPDDPGDLAVFGQRSPDRKGLAVGAWVFTAKPPCRSTYLEGPTNAGGVAMAMNRRLLLGVVAATVAAAVLVVAPAEPAMADTGYFQVWDGSAPAVVRTDQDVVLRHYNTQSCQRPSNTAVECFAPDYDVEFRVDGHPLGGGPYVPGEGYDFGVLEVVASDLSAGSQIIEVVRTPEGGSNPTSALSLGVTVVDPVRGGDRIDNLYRFLLGRPADPDGAMFFAGRSDADIAAALLSSRERQAWFVREVLYPRFLNRRGDVDGVAFFADLMASGVDERRIAGSMIASAENQSWVNSMSSTIACDGPGTAPIARHVAPMYIDLLRRGPESCEAATYWSQAGAQAAGAMAMSSEGAERVVEEAYLLYLDRMPAAPELDYWVAVLATHAPVTLTHGIVGSAEYAALWG